MFSGGSAVAAQFVISAWRALLSALLVCLSSGSVVAQTDANFPSKPIRWIVPFAPGSTDLLARVIGQKASEALGQPLVIETRPGAGGSIGTGYVARSAADGYTLLMGTIATHGINSGLYAKLPYDAVTDFAPLCLLGFAPNVLLVHPSVEAKNVRELIALARRNPGMTYSSPGAGTSTHMAGELFQSMSDSKLTHVPYKGTSDAVLAVVRGDVQMVFSNLPPAMPLIKDGRVKALAVTTTGRVSLLPDLPTVSETGLNGYDVSVWFGAFAPAGLAPALVSRISNALMNAATDPVVSEKLIQQGFVVKILRPGEFSGFVRDEISKWTKVVRQAGIKAE